MDLRSIALFGILGYFSAKALKAPYIAALLMAWMSYMNPHRLTGHWGFAYDLPIFFAVAALAASLGAWALMTRQARLPKVGFIGFLMVLFIVWLGVTTLFAEFPRNAMEGYTRFLKIQVSIFLTLLLINDTLKLKQLIWVIFISIGFFGVKGGVFGILTGGGDRVWGPEGTFIEGNNELALALIMILPLGYFLYQDSTNKWIRYGLIGSLGIITIAILASYSRGAFLALACTTCFLWLKSSKKLPIAAMMIATTLVLIPFMPQQWFDRMNTIETYEEDASAMGRINAWHMAFNLASDRLTGGGYDTWSSAMFAQYAPIPGDVHDAHSIYFEVLGEHGFPALFLFLLIFGLTWLKASAIKRRVREIDEFKSVSQLMGMCQVSLVAYATGGAFLGLAFWDLPYHIIAIVIISGNIVEKRRTDFRTSRQAKAANPVGAAAPRPPG